MRQIVINEEDFDRIFNNSEKEYQYNHDFMKGDENVKKFKETMRYRHLIKFRNTLKTLKTKLVEA